MQRFGLYYAQDWYVTLSSWQKELVRTSWELLAREERLQSNFSDYSFIVFPMAKAYEGFLKDFFYKIDLIDRITYENKHFRIGKAINPDISPSRRDGDWLYNDIAQMCSPELAREMWDTWLECRNQIFHYFPNNERKISLQQATDRLEMIARIMDGMNSCKIQDQKRTTKGFYVRK